MMSPQCARDGELKKAFNTLRPICVDVLQDKSETSLIQLRNALLKVDELALDELQEYVLFALRIAFKKSTDKGENYLIALYECSSTLADHIHIDSENIFMEFINHMAVGISRPFPGTDLSDVFTNSRVICEEIKLNAVIALNSFFNCASEKVLKCFYSSVDCFPLLGSIVFILLGYIEHEKYAQLRFSAVKCLMKLARCELHEANWHTSCSNIVHLSNAERACKHDSCNDNSVNNVSSCGKILHNMTQSPSAPDDISPQSNTTLTDLDIMVGNLFASFIPKISTSLTKAALADSKQGQLVTSSIVAAFSSIVERVFSDEQLDQPHHLHLPDESKCKALLVDKNKEWVTDTGDKLCFLIDRIADLLSDDGWRIRYELVNMAALLMDRCNKSLKKSFKRLFNIIICSSVDAQALVKNSSSSVIERMRCKMLTRSGGHLNELLQDNLFCLVEDLPASIMFAGDSKRLSTLNLLVGHLKLLNTNAATLFQSDVHVDCLLKSFFNILEFDCSVSLVSADYPDHQILMDLKSSHPTLSKYSFKNFTDELVLSHSHSIFEMIGRCCDLHHMIDKLLGTMLGPPCSDRKQAAFCLVDLLIGFSSSCEDRSSSKNNLFFDDKGQKYNERYSWSDVELLMNMIIDQVLDNCLWTDACEITSCNVPTFSVTPSSSSTFLSSLIVTKPSPSNMSKLQNSGSGHVFLTPKEIKEEIIFSCLLLDVLGAVSMVMGRRFECCLSQVLLPVLERIGSSRPEIRCRAFNALYNMAKSTSDVEVCYASSGDEGGLVVRMLIRCSDYLMSASISQLKSLSGHPGILTALRVVVQLSTPLQLSSTSSSTSLQSSSSVISSSSQVLKIVNSAFKQVMYSLDNHYHEHALQFLKLLLQISKLAAFIVQQQHQQQQTHHQQQQHYENQSSQQIFYDRKTHVNNAEEHSTSLPSSITSLSSFSTTSSSFSTSSVAMFSSPTTVTSSMLLLSSRTSAPSAEHNTNSNTSHNLSDTTQVTVVNDVNNSPNNNNNNTPERMRMILTDRLKSCVLNLQSELLMKVKQEEELSSQLADDDGSDDSSHLLNGDNNNNINNHSNSNDNNNDNNDNNDYSNRDVDSDSNRSLPYYVNMMEQILDRCQHFLIFPSVHVRLTTLHIVSVLCPALKSYQDVLLPLVHKIWKPFVNRFKDEEHFIAIKAFEVLKEISEASGDFVRRRMVTEVMPKVIEALTSLARKSVKQPSSYQYTTACKLQSCILLNLGPMSRYADIQGQALMNIVHPCMPYLSAKQPTILQQVCMDTILEFVKIDSSIVWLALCQAYSPRSKLVPPNITSSSSSLHNFQLCPPANLPSYQLKTGALQTVEYTSFVWRLHELLSNL